LKAVSTVWSRYYYHYIMWLSRDLICTFFETQNSRIGWNTKTRYSIHQQKVKSDERFSSFSFIQNAANSRYQAGSLNDDVLVPEDTYSMMILLVVLD